MAGASDKARFYLEQSVPELKEYERKKIFSSHEITSIIRKRSDFEHKLNGRGSLPSDYARYAEFEINVDSLRKKRVKRLGVKTPAYNGNKRIFFVLDRGTRKFPGDLGLWMQSVGFARTQRAHKRLSQILTNALRLHPTKPDLWIYGAQFAMEEHADMTEARNYMQRGLRFCKNARKMWLEYTRLEMSYMAKITARRKILGVDKNARKLEDVQELENANADLITLPKLTMEDIAPSLQEKDDADHVDFRALDSTPAMTGGIPIAIFDAAMDHFQHDPAFGKSFFDVCLEFTHVPGARRVLDHIVEDLMQTKRTGWEAQACYIEIATAGLDINSPAFPAALGESLRRLKEVLAQSPYSVELIAEVSGWIGKYVQNEALDPSLHKVLTFQLRSLKQIASPA